MKELVLKATKYYAIVNYPEPMLYSETRERAIRRYAELWFQAEAQKIDDHFREVAKG